MSDFVKLLDCSHIESYKILNLLKKHRINPIVKDIQTMKSYLKDGLKGIQNLKETYATDTQTCARLDVIINKILNILDNE